MQQSPIDPFFKQAVRYITTFGIMAILVACGGGGSGPPPTLNYSGVTTPVVIDADNAYTLLTGAYEGGQTTSAFNIFGAAQAESLLAANTPRMLTLATVFEAFLYDMESLQSTPYAGAIITDSDHIFGSYGGSVYYDVGIDSIFGDQAAFLF